MDRAWIEFFDPNGDGRPEHPYGDLYRMWLINPAVIQMCLAAARRKAGEDDLTSIDLGLAVQGQFFSSDHGRRLRLEKLEEWHGELLKQMGNWKPLKDLRILDLGCGIGYLAPILTGLGATYFGFDRSPALIKKAMDWWSPTCQGRAFFQEFDLAGLPSDSAKAAEALCARCGRQAPDFILAVNVLEYLQKPEILLAASRHLLAPKYDTASAFFITPNPDYYIKLPSRDGKPPFFKEPEEITIACLNGRISKEQCRLLGRFRVSELLRDSGFVTLQEGFLTVPAGGDSELRHHYEQGCETVNLGLAPFVGFTAIPLPVGRPPTEAEWNEIRSKSALKYLEDAKSPSHDEKLIKEIKAEGVIITLKKDERLLARHNLGGRLYIVVKGQFSAPKTPENVFEPSDLFGELEANFCVEPGGMRYGCYVNDVVGMEESSAVFIIPTPVATKLVGPGSSLRANLFATLREKVILRNARLTLRKAWEQPLRSLPDWSEFSGVNRNAALTEAASRFFFQTISGNPFVFVSDNSGKDKYLGAYELGRVAGALLELQEIEHCKYGRCQWAHCVLAHILRLGGIADFTGDEIRKYVRALHWLGALDAFAPAKQVCGKEVVAIVQRHFEAKAPSNPAGETNPRDAIQTWAKTAASVQLWSDDNNIRPQLQDSFNDIDVRRLLNKPDAAFLDHTLTTLARVNWLLFDATPNFFVVRDLPLLRSLAYDPEKTLKRHLFSRAFSLDPSAGRNHNGLPELKDLATKAKDANAQGRLDFYAAALCQFIATDLEKHDGALCYSTGVAADRVPSVPAVTQEPPTRANVLRPGSLSQMDAL